MSTTRPDKNASSVRPRTLYLGTDERGYDYLLKTERATEEIVVVHGGERVLVDQLHELRVEHVVATVADEVGWRECRWNHYDSKPVPRKYA